MYMSDYIEKQRSQYGFLTKKELIKQIGEKNILLDDTSILISTNVRVGEGNTFYPNVVIEQLGDSIVEIKDNNIFYPGSYIFGAEGTIRIGSGNEFGPAGITIKANTANAHVEIGDNGRYCDGASIMGETKLGSGSQVLGSIAVQNCELAGGDTFRDPDPDTRAAVLKGFGLARNLSLSMGEVMNGSGDFTTAAIERQSSYHPKAK